MKRCLDNFNLENEFDSTKATITTNKRHKDTFDILCDVDYDYGNKKQNNLLLSTESIKMKG